jgi:hypothetical protein
MVTGGIQGKISRGVQRGVEAKESPKKVKRDSLFIWNRLFPGNASNPDIFIK